jgi:hypothetical protein
MNEVEERMHAVVKAMNGKGDIDTAPDETEVHRERLRSYVNNFTLTALNEMSDLRDECGELIRTVHECQETLLHQIDAFSMMARSLRESKKIMSEALHEITDQFKTLPIVPTMPPTPMLRQDVS